MQSGSSRRRLNGACRALDRAIEAILGDDAGLLAASVQDDSEGDACTCPGPDFVDRICRAVRSAAARAGAACSRCSTPAGSRGTGYVSILPVDQGIEHSAGASFAPNPAYFDPENIVKLAIEGGCNAVASTLGVLGVGRAAGTRTRFRSS